MKLNVTELSELTGFNRKTVGERLSILKHSDGPNGAKLYCSVKALPTICLGVDKDTNRQRLRSEHIQQLELFIRISHLLAIKEKLPNEFQGLFKQAKEDAGDEIESLPSKFY